MATTAPVAPRASSDRAFYLGIAIAFVVVVFVGFSRSFFLRPLFPAHPSPTEPIFYVHGALFTAWCVLLVVQTALIRARRTALHRRIGPWGAVLAGAMVAAGTHGALVAARRPTGFVSVPAPAPAFLIVPIADMLLFGAFVAIAVVKRRDVQAHKRWMVLATINIITAAVARWPGVLGGSPLLFFALTDLFIVALIVWDRRSRRAVHRATAWGGATIVLSQPLRLVLSGTAAWLAVAHWLVNSPL